MNAETIWLAWTSDGWDIPLVVCQAIAGCVNYWSSGGDDCSFALHDFSGAPSEVIVTSKRLPGYSTCVLVDEEQRVHKLTPEAVALLKRWVARFAQSAVDHIPPVQVLVGSREAKDWAGGQ